MAQIYIPHAAVMVSGLLQTWPTGQGTAAPQTGAPVKKIFVLRHSFTSEYLYM